MTRQAREALPPFDVEAYVEEYVLCADEGDYEPTEHERLLITDALHGALFEMQEAQREAALAAQAAPGAGDEERGTDSRAWLREVAIERSSVGARLRTSAPAAAAEALAWLEAECADLRCIALPTGGGDADVGWDVVTHHMARPTERIVGHGSTPLSAVKDAMRAPPGGAAEEGSTDG